MRCVLGGTTVHFVFNELNKLVPAQLIFPPPPPFLRMGWRIGYGLKIPLGACITYQSRRRERMDRINNKM